MSERKPIKIVETVLRDGHQSLIATRMTTEQMLPIIEKMDQVGYHAVECWGGATFDASLRFLKEDPSKELSTVATCEDIVAMKEDVKNVYVHPVLIDYIVELARMTRQQDNVSIGVSPRGTLGMLNAARAYAYVAGRDYVVPEDIKILAPVVWAHRIVLQTGYMNMDNKEQIIEHVVNNTAVPTEDWKR